MAERDDPPEDGLRRAHLHPTAAPYARLRPYPPPAYDGTLQDVAALSSLVSAMWLSVAILTAGYARTRNRSPWTWFLLTVFLGPIAAFLLVVWPPRPADAPQEPGR